MKLHRLLVLFFLSLGACGQPLGQVSNRQGLQNATPDTGVQSSDKNTEYFVRPHDCRAQIARAMCLVDTDQVALAKNELPDNSLPRVCLPGGAVYASAFEAVHDRLPAALQQMFCSIKKIYIEKDLYASAYAETDAALDSNLEMRSNGAYLGVRLAAMGDQLSYGEWATWKEQLSFGGSTLPGEPDATLPIVRSVSPAGVNDLLYAHIVHEFAHLLDTANHLNPYRDCSEELGGRLCTFQSEAWAQLSWANSRQPLAAFDFSGRERFCFYACEGSTLSNESLDAVYAELDQGNFINSYAATNFREDFASTFEIFMMIHYLGTRLELVTPSGKVYDLAAHLQSPQMSEKYQYIKRILASQHLDYP